ncbi:hypothetical protein QOZ80_5BG0416560 [Eleusine coracana subsp. coracana]|nr:hypothetical protein QOZ80_5BG0416560 [Eleusine coracana subsp. coracana]
MQGVQSTRRISPRTKASIATSKTATSPKTPKENVVMDKAKVPPSDSKLSNPGSHQRSYLESNVSRKESVTSKGIKAVTELKSMPTPINLYEDECVFCHSFRTSVYHGPMVHYLMGRIASSDEGNPSNGIYVHRKCLECSICGLWGAALGCYYKRCNKTFHVPCAVQIYDCRWDVNYKHVWCPEHVSHVPPCEQPSSQTKQRHQFSSLPQSQYSEKVQNFDDYQGENQETGPPSASNSSSVPQSHSQCSHNEAISTHSSRKGQQIDQRTASSSSLKPSCSPDEEGISTACHGEKMNIDQQEAPNYSSDKWVLLGSLLSASEKDFLEEFARWTKATVANEWGENVTHVIVGKHAGRAWSRSYDVLMAILFGKWIVRTEWIVDCLEMRPDVEDSYVVTCRNDSGKPLDGPKKGRTRAAEGAPKLFSGLDFCLSASMNPRDRGHMRNLVAAAGGCVLERSSSLNWRWVRGDSSLRPYFVYDGGAPGEFSASSLRMEAEEAREQAAAGDQPPDGAGRRRGV